MAFEVEFSKRLDLFGAEIFAALNDKKVALEAQGKKLYNLSVGTPDFEPMPHIKQALCDAAMVSENWKYSLRDLPELLDTVCAYYKRRFDVDGITPDQIMSFNGSQDGMGHMGLALLNDGDVVLLPDPCYPVFITGVKLGGGVPYYYHLTKEHNFLPNVKEIPDDVADKAKIMIVSLPANPVGSVGSPELYQEIVDFCNAHKILLIHDNAYSDIIFDGAVGHSIFNIPGAETCAVEFFSLSKSFNVTGARISFLVGRRDVIAACKKLRTQIDFGKFIPEQKAAIAAMTGPDRIPIICVFSDKIKGSVRLCQQIVKQCIRCINTICKIIPFTQVLTLCPYHMTAEHIICIAFPDDLRIVTGCCNRKSTFFYLICCGLLPNGRTAGGATGCKACQKPCNGQHTNHFFLNHTQTPAFRFHPIEPASDVHDGLDYREDFPLSLFLCVHGIS